MVGKIRYVGAVIELVFVCDTAACISRWNVITLKVTWLLFGIRWRPCVGLCCFWWAISGNWVLVRAPRCRWFVDAAPSVCGVVRRQVRADWRRFVVAEPSARLDIGRRLCLLCAVRFVIHFNCFHWGWSVSCSSARWVGGGGREGCCFLFRSWAVTAARRRQAGWEWSESG